MTTSKSINIRLVATLFAAALFWAPLGCTQPGQNRLLESPRPAGFEQIGPVLVYNKTTLFDFMNGEAEVYFPLGFRLLYTQVYRSENSDARMAVEIYDMTSEAGSSGAFAHYGGEGGSRVQGVGVSASSDEWLLLFTRGPYFVRISPDPSKENRVEPTPEDKVALARAIDAMLN
jgi:hypothetical protein